jgi:hypothetical protein
MPEPLTFETFRESALARGFDEVMERHWEPEQIVDQHQHPFDAKALVVRGEMWLTVGADTQHLLAGDTFDLERGRPHSERYGQEGATYWVARRAG